MVTENIIRGSIYIVEDFETESSILLGQVAGMGSCTYQGSGGQKSDDLTK